MAGLLSQGFGDAQQRAMQAAQFGFGAEQFADPQRRAGLLGSQMSGLPWGQVQTGPNPNYQNAASGFLGGGPAGATPRSGAASCAAGGGADAIICRSTGGTPPCPCCAASICRTRGSM
jgi:hypothetical protein